MDQEQLRARYVATVAYLEHIEERFRAADFDRWEAAHKSWVWSEHLRDPFMAQATATLAREDDAMRRAVAAAATTPVE